MKRHLPRIALAIALALVLLGLTHAATGGNPVLASLVDTGDPGADPDDVGIHAPHWETAYHGDGNRSYDLDGDGVDAEGECANCHMGTGNATDDTDLHTAPLHPFGTHANDTGNWFHDADDHRGPDVAQPPQPSGLTVNTTRLDCGDCHTPTNTSTYPFDTDATGDPHAVHRDVIEREGCPRCHADGNVTFSGAVTFTQGNSSPETYNVSTPINMTRVHDGAFLSTVAEANYTRTDPRDDDDDDDDGMHKDSYEGGDATLSRNGTGWAVYNRTETDRATRRGCGDCHDRYHAEKTPSLAFTLDATSRGGPRTDAGDGESYGVDASGVQTCGACHTLDLHAVHTDGNILYTADFSTANSTAAPLPDDLLGAETCDECHSQNVGAPGLNHSEFFQRRGLGGTVDSSNDRLPDAPARIDDLAGSPGQNDCGFCHVR